MSLKNMTIIEGPTIAVSNPESSPEVTLGNDGVAVQGGSHFIVKEDLDYETRRQVTVKHRPPVYDTKTAAFGKDKKTVCLAVPQVLASGRIVFNTIRIEREVHPSFSTGATAKLMKMGAQLILSDSMEDFWCTGDIS